MHLSLADNRLSEYRMSKKECRRKKAKNHRLPNPHFVIRHASFVIHHRGLTLIEMLIGMAITLVMMAAVVTLFANIGAGIRVQRAAMEMSSQLRTTRARLFMDLAGATCDGIPKSTPGDDGKADGYIEIVEGQWSDKAPSALMDGIDNATNPELDYTISQVPSGGDPAIVPPAIGATGAVTNGGGLGDYDDILALTVRSDSEPFIGQWTDKNGNVKTVKSDLAEVIWYAVENPADGSLGEPGMRTVYRRVLLIAPWVQDSVPTPVGGNLAADLLNFYRDNDISVRRESTSTGFIWVPNSLSDLTKRENRFGHFLDPTGGLGFPFAVDQTAVRALTYDLSNASVPPSFNFGPLRPFGPPFDGPASSDRQGQDLMLNDVLAFDVRVYDPGAPILNVSPIPNVLGTVVEPSEAGWDLPAPPVNLAPVGFGAYVDLHWNVIDTWSLGTLRGWTPLANAPTPLFDGVPNSKSGLNFSTASIASVAYDTWSFHYEKDGIDQDDGGGGPIDEGMNGLDDDVGFGAINGVDDVGERETSPPYNVPLRGIQVKLRVYEPDTRQIREATVTRGFVPQ